MKVYLLKDVERVGIAGEVIKVSNGYAKNYLLPKKFAIQVTPQNESYYKEKVRQVDNRKEAIATETSMLAEKIKRTTLTLKRKMHDDAKLYGAVTPGEIVDLLKEKGISIAKNQVQLSKSIKLQGDYDITIKLSSRLQPALKLKVVSE